MRDTLSSVWFGSCWRENVLGVHKENTINYSLHSSFIKQDYHPQSIHHNERVVCILHICTAKYARLRKHTQTRSTECQPKPLIHSATGKRSKWACVCVSRCLMFWYEACRNQSPMYTNMIITLSSLNAPLRAIMVAKN